MSFRLRYAPSPTGFLHIGNTRTALMNYLFAKHYNGSFIVRIEDTDLARNVDGAIESQFENLNWLGIFPDESIFNVGDQKYGKYMQSQKFDRYKQLAEQLVNQNKAYRCFCSSEELEKDYEEQTSKEIIATKYSQKCLFLTQDQISQNLKDKKEYSIRFKVPQNKVWTINDIVRGDVSFDSKDLGDFVILKSNGVATYNFAVVIDDYDMQITHVLRGEEHISNTPRQMMIYDAFNWNYPKFGHLTLIVDNTGKKLSKRSGNALFFIEQYKKQGYLSQAIFNYIALLGWSPPGEQEILSQNELIKIFDEKRFSKSPSTFDMVKMKWINSVYMKKLEDNEYLEFVKSFINTNKFDITSKSEAWLNHLLLLYKKELEYAEQINDHLDLFFNKNTLDNNTIDVLNNLTNYKNVVEIFKNQINDLKDWTIENIKQIIKDTSTLANVKGKDLFMPIRIFATKSEHGPSLADVIYLLGKTTVLNNINSLER
ncbi:glutamate--tRNA ligase [Mycoplasma mycoides subsp. mycoides]|uniref:Glutamate--tRNA ligase n=2 Tax=Mycoplasma mycoides subsp. mycoides TaxID=2103 RepID=SYE_MYCMS|nr:glutamate--tRNA ligase [Mycoplasma mycoides]Q6MUA6.1 RecName: Full=Glutamate--tRNA ligase; AltName: Full=Glutamyl-tRNA synthetase; Short=GluRS [Mycoplasma mycoides subsp. mycoides SC str. PG1]ADK69850.1 glutamate--tRNA ligase [Mycoplasma mycoides subsp. mycoides SC str. Gladysdale]AIZ54978.1 Glutamate--tRNA ligase [Mycoplasma mycoides subsp. mycoides]AME10340.1 glutamyl-tRNA synthetase [Mycoplasma mycoides subsp. mycoides]AME11342.1 glutamyl-tRNA synthetase [Mycoplasma mycoides subsp. mycoi